MSYAFEYESGGQKRYSVNLRKRRSKKALTPFLLMIAAAFVLFAVIKIDKIKMAILPGNPQVTEAALSAFVEDLKAGEEFYDAFTVFCKEIITDGMEDPG